MTPTVRPWLERQLLAVAATFVEDGVGDFPVVAATATGARLQELLGQLSAGEVRLLHLGGRALDLRAALRFGRCFHRLDIVRRRRVLAALADSTVGPFRRLHQVLKQLTQLAYFMDEGTWGAIGYDGPWLGRIDVTVASPPALGRVEELQ